MRKAILFLMVAVGGCGETTVPDKLFSLLPSSQTGIDFTNELILDEDFDVFRYRNYYNGGGVAIGDINNDGLPDIYLTANVKDNRLYLNQGDFRFRNISEAAGIQGEKAWSTGVSMADVDGDGWLDIYVCNSGDVYGGKRENELYINNHDLTFSQRAAEFGLDDKGFGTHAVFFDYDLDNDLDCYILNNSFRPVSSLGLENIRHERDSTGGDKLYRNDGNRFVDVSREAGIFGSVIGFGLGVTVGDINLDGWSDLYISNDFFERDYLYINRGDGTFSEELQNYMGQTSLFSMGADVGDINNDGYPEIFVTDMLPGNDYRLKTTTSFDTYDYYLAKKKNGYYEQFMRNTLQLNNADGTFSEIGQYAGVDASDWSWGGIIMDFDNDGYKEIFVANGIYKDVTNQDFIDYLANEDNILEAMRSEKVNFQEMVDKMPSTKISNYLFKKGQGLTFRNVAPQWGLDQPSFSNGSAYGDLDNDGDLDLVVNNVNQEAFVYRNNATQQLHNNYLIIRFQGTGRNTMGLGARVRLYTDSSVISAENMPMRGFQSSMDYKMVIGLGSVTTLDSLVVFWGPKIKQTLTNVSANDELLLRHQDSQPVNGGETTLRQVFKRIDDQRQPNYVHKENNYIDFDYQRLLYHMVSREGPALTSADLNDDGLDDLYVGGAQGQVGSIMIQRQDGSFDPMVPEAFKTHQRSEDVDATFFDADGDGDMDLYVGSGGNSAQPNQPQYQDRLYVNTGTPKRPAFELTSRNIPLSLVPTSCVRPADFDADGDIDLFVGGRHVPGSYGMPANSTLLRNNGQGMFQDVTIQIAPRLNNLGLVKDAQWVDYDGDSDLDLVVVGEWLPIVLFKNNGTNLERLYNVPGLTENTGWWNCILPYDLDDDGDVDFIVGNWGLNNKFKASMDEPVRLYISDFDQNGSLDHIFSYYENGKEYPMALRGELVMQLNYLKKRFVYHEDYANKTVPEVFTPEELTNAVVLHVSNLESSIVINNGDGSYLVQPLPEKAQLAPIMDIAEDDFDGDGKDEFIIAGNFAATKPEVGKYNASYGLMLKYLGAYQFKVVTPKESGFFVKGDVRKVQPMHSVGNKRMLMVARNDDRLEGFEYGTDASHE